MKFVKFLNITVSFMFITKNHCKCASICITVWNNRCTQFPEMAILACYFKLNLHVHFQNVRDFRTLHSVLREKFAVLISVNQVVTLENLSDFIYELIYIREFHELM